MCAHLRRRHMRCGLCEYRQSLFALLTSPNERVRDFAEARALFCRLKREQGPGSAHQTLLSLAQRNVAEARRRFPGRYRLGH